MMASSPICLLLKALKTKSWLWHRRLSHLNFGAINHLARHGLVRGLPKLKFEKDHMCSACAMGKSKNKPHKPKYEDTNQEKLYLLHMDLCGPMRVASVNGKKYILVIVDDYSRFTWEIQEDTSPRVEGMHPKLKDTLSSCLNSEEQQMQQIQDKAKKSCIVSFRQLHSHLKLLSNNDLQGTRTESGFKRAFATLFGQDIETFIGTMFLNVDQLEKQLDKEEFQEIGSMAAFKVLEI
ncbi:retrovirus-related pol polyprotein from transposon TNT 1-94 [Tanacetum coccineum]